MVAALLALGLAWSGPSGASETAARRYAVMSLIGDRLLVVGDRARADSNFDQNTREIRELDNDVMDRIALLSVDAALKKLNPGVSPTLLAVRNPRWFALQDLGLETGASVRALVDSLRGALAGHDVSHLLLVSKHRSFASFKSVGSFFGHGQIEGLGYYVDRQTWTRPPGGGDAALGFLAPFAYLKVSLIDVATLAVVREQPFQEEQAVSAARAGEGAHPWDALSPEEKVRLLRLLIERGLARVVPAVATAR